MEEYDFADQNWLQHTENEGIKSDLEPMPIYGGPISRLLPAKNTSFLTVEDVQNELNLLDLDTGVTTKTENVSCAKFETYGVPRSVQTTPDVCQDLPMVNPRPCEYIPSGHPAYQQMFPYAEDDALVPTTLPAELSIQSMGSNFLEHQTYGRQRMYSEDSINSLTSEAEAMSCEPFVGRYGDQFIQSHPQHHHAGGYHEDTYGYVNHPSGTRSKFKTETKKRERRCLKLRHWLLYLLENPDVYRNVIVWLDRNSGTFIFLDSKEVALMWGQKKKKKGEMTYEHMARALRHYYAPGIMSRVRGRRLVYKFGPNADMWKQVVAGRPVVLQG